METLQRQRECCPRARFVDAKSRQYSHVFQRRYGGLGICHAHWPKQGNAPQRGRHPPW